MSVNKKAARAGLHGGSLHSSQTGWWGCVLRDGEGVGKKKKNTERQSEGEGKSYAVIGRKPKTGGGVEEATTRREDRTEAKREGEDWQGGKCLLW